MFKGAERWKRISFAGNALGLGIKGPVYTHKVGELGKDSHLHVCGNVNWCRHHGKQYGGSSKNQKQSCHMT